jgi:hypothetical protein
VKKPVMSTQDLRFFDAPDPPLLHRNRRHNGAWTQRYEHGMPVTGLLPAEMLTRWPSLVMDVGDERPRTATSQPDVITLVCRTQPFLSTANKGDATGPSETVGALR